MKYLVLVTIGLFTATAFSQTKLIAHRSHSGADAVFTLNSLDNFGNPPNWKEVELEQLRQKSLQEKKEPDSLKKAPVAIDSSSVKIEEKQKAEKTKAEPTVPVQKKKRKAAKKKAKEKSKVVYSRTVEDEKTSEVALQPKKAGTGNIFGLILLLLVPGIFVFAGSFRKTDS